ncbi:MAG TPA: hypothetical protein PKU97_24790, partial [Kofleriaceae bacterium]|nr:hypothetical protein [Kofleriaceae bacterium]
MPSDESVDDVPTARPGASPPGGGRALGVPAPQRGPAFEGETDLSELSPEKISRVHEVMEILEHLAGDLRRLGQLDEPTRIRLVTAAGRLARPDRYSRKALAKVLARQRIREVRSADQAVLDQTGIRALRKEPVFRTPLPMPAQALDAPVRDDGDPDDGGWAAAEARREELEAGPAAADGGEYGFGVDAPGRSGEGAPGG